MRPRYPNRRLFTARHLLAHALLLFGQPLRPAHVPHRLLAQSQPVSPRTHGANAWSLPDAHGLIRQVIERIVAQDRPAGIPIPDFSMRRFGRVETRETVRRFKGITLSNAAFASVMAWEDGRDLGAEPCLAPRGIGCDTPSALWLAITHLGRGEKPHELFVWYTTAFSAPPPLEGAAPQAQRYTFCERWQRTRGRWEYAGFVRVVSH